MSTFRMVWRYLLHRPIITLLIIGGIALGSGLISGVLSLRKAVDDLFLRDSALFDMVVGGKGSPLQLVLSSIYHMDVPTGNIPLSMLQELRENKKVSSAIPISLGDNVGGFRIVGSDDSLFTYSARKADRLFLDLVAGRRMEAAFEAVVGRDVAASLHLKLGDVFYGTHGLVQGFGSEIHDEMPYVVVGMLGETGTALDRVVLTPLESVWQVHEGKRSPEGGREITSVLVTLKTPGLRMWLADQIQRDHDVMAVVPLNQMLRVQQRLLKPLTRVLVIISALVILVSAVSISISMILTADRRQRDWNVLRNLGAKPRDILWLLFLEALVLSLVGVLLGAGVVHGFMAFMDGASWGVPGLQPMSLLSGKEEALALLSVLICGIAASFIPAFIAYAKNPDVR